MQAVPSPAATASRQTGAALRLAWFALCVAAATIAAAWHSPAAAQGPDDPQAFILELRADILAATAPERPRTEARAALDPLIAEAFDFPAIAQAALRGVADVATAAQRDRLGRVLARRMGDELIRRQGGAAVGFRIAAVRALAAEEWLVVSQVAPPDAPATVLAWRIRRATGRLRIVDVVRDGVSVVIVQREEIEAAVRAGRALDAVIDDIERRGQPGK